MKVYIAHSREFDYQTELYAPIRNCGELAAEEIILPHECSQSSSNTRDFYANLDLIIAEVSFPATGLGIELGWAFDSNVPVVCIYRKGAKYSGSLHAVTDEFYEYDGADEMLAVIAQVIQQHAQ